MTKAGGGLLVRIAYTALLILVAPAYVLRLWWRGRAEPLYRDSIGERFGFYRSAPSAGSVWVHAVSLGETRAAAALIEALRRERPGLRFLLTHGTATGRTAGQALLRDGDRQAWLPYDAAPVVRRFLRHFNPAIGVLMETEVWPNLIQVTSASGVPMVLANARLSAKSLRRGRRLDALLRPAVERLALVLAQTDDDAQRLRAAGAPTVVVSGNLKFDMAPDSGQLARGQTWRELVGQERTRSEPAVDEAKSAEPAAPESVALASALAAVQASAPEPAGDDPPVARARGREVVLAAVTREGEEEPLLAAWVRQPEPRPLLVVVPRHPQRFDAVEALVQAAGLASVRRSTWDDEPPAAALEADVWIGDSMGEMALYYAMARVALLGGSFAPLGGQNLIEAAACGCPVIMGPHTFNFAEAAELSLAMGASRRVDDIEAGVLAAVGLLGQPDQVAMSAAALAFAREHGGAAARMAAPIMALAAAPAGSEAAAPEA